MSNAIKYDHTLLGVQNAIGTFFVSKEMILSFARATGETKVADEESDRNPESDDLIAPPTFCNLFISDLVRPDIKLEFGDTGFLAGQTIVLLKPIRSGDILKARTILREVYEKTGRSGRMVFIVWETNFTDEGGEAVANVRESFVRTKRGE